MEVRRRSTRQRQMVLDAVLSRGDHPSAEDVYLAVRERDGRISRGTVYRNLNLLADEGAIQMVKTPQGGRFDRRRDAHAHIVCTSCGRMFDLALPYDHALDGRARRETGFADVTHHALFEGVCPECASRGGEEDAG